MKIYYYETQSDSAYLYTKERLEQFDPNPPRSLAGEWSIPEFKVVVSDESHSFMPLTDFPTFSSTVPCVSPRTVDLLRTIFENCGELLPIRLTNHRELFYLFNVTRVINAIDMQRSKFMELPSGSIGPCERLVLQPTLIPDEALFFKSTQMGVIPEIYVTERAVRAVKKAKLTGHDFRMAWTDE